MTPPDFRSFVHSIAAEIGLPSTRIVLGGDHLGPHVWRSQGERRRDGDWRATSCATTSWPGSRRSTSTPACGSPTIRRIGPLDEATVAERAADLCAVAEAAAALLPADAPRPVYVVGSEVPIPGGELADSAAPAVTSVDAVERTLDETRRAFTRHGVGGALERVLALVTQPGVEFGDAVVFEYDDRAAAALASRTPTGRRSSTRRTPRTTRRRRPCAGWSVTTSRSSRSAPASPSRSGRRCSRSRRSRASGWPAVAGSSRPASARRSSG